MKITFVVFSKEILASKLLSFVMLDRRVFFFLLITWRKEMEGRQKRNRWSCSHRAGVWLVRYISCRDEPVV